jgi:hypothetical protein
MEQCPTSWRGGVKRLLMQVEVAPNRIQFGEEGDQVLQ